MDDLLSRIPPSDVVTERKTRNALLRKMATSRQVTARHRLDEAMTGFRFAKTSISADAPPPPPPPQVRAANASSSERPQGPSAGPRFGFSQVWDWIGNWLFSLEFRERVWTPVIDEDKAEVLGWLTADGRLTWLQWLRVIARTITRPCQCLWHFLIGRLVALIGRLLPRWLRRLWGAG